MKPDLSSHVPTEILEQRAAEQRDRIHESVSELKSSMKETLRERLDVESYTRKHLWPILGVASFVGLMAGYATAAVFGRS